MLAQARKTEFFSHVEASSGLPILIDHAAGDGGEVFQSA